MARELKYRSWDDYGKKEIKNRLRYPWHRWLNGSMWFLVEGEDYGDHRDFQKYIHAYARNHGMRVRTKRNEAGTGMFIQAFKATTGDGAQRRRHFRAVERRFVAQQYGDLPEDWEPEEHLQDENWDPSINEEKT